MDSVRLFGLREAAADLIPVQKTRLPYIPSGYNAHWTRSTRKPVNHTSYKTCC